MVLGFNSLLLSSFKAMDFLPKEIEDYALANSAEEPSILTKLSRETNANVLMPRMLSGHLQGRILSMISHMIKPSRVLELGTYTGYSAICLAEGLAEGGILHTIDINEEIGSMVKRYFEESGYNDRIRFHLGDAATIIPGLNEKLDLVFIDADKENYCRYFDLVFPFVREGGWIIADNVLWSGKVLENIKRQDKETLALKEYSSKIRSDKRVECVLLPVRDGLMICRKLKG